MPLYEYECDRGHRFERIVKFSDPPLEACPACGAPVHKLMSSPAIQFKGSGWYITDYARKGTEKTDSKEAKDSKPAGESAGESTASKGTESPATKTEKPAATESAATKKTETSTASTKAD
jgi:putative FmdB family regulatory protein